MREDGVVAPRVELARSAARSRVAAACRGPMRRAGRARRGRPGRSEATARPGRRARRDAPSSSASARPTASAYPAKRATLSARSRQPSQQQGSARRPRAGAAPPPSPGREPRRACRRSRWSRPGAHRTVRPARAPPARRPSGSGRSARDPARSRRRTGREAARPSRHAPGRRRGRAPPAHGSRVVLPLRLTSSPTGTKVAQSEEREGPKGRRLRLGRSPAVQRRQARDFGLRPRRATAAPGIPPAHESQRSAAFAPRRASLNVTRMHRALSLLYLRTAAVANEHRLSRHDSLPIVEIAPRFPLDG